MSEPVDKNAAAEERFQWLMAYMNAGFKRREAIKLLAQPQVTINSSQPEYPPELYEFWQRQNAAALTIVDEMTDE